MVLLSKIQNYFYGFRLIFHIYFSIISFLFQSVSFFPFSPGRDSGSIHIDTDLFWNYTLLYHTDEEELCLL